MAELDVQPKQRKTPWWLWLLIGLILLALLFFLVRGCNKKGENVTGTSSDSVSTTTNPGANAAGATTSTNWDSIDFNAPKASYEEITDTNISVRGNENYGIYSLGESVLFSTGSSAIRSEAIPNLKQIAGSLSKRYSGGDIRIYGYTDATGDAAKNKQLAEKRTQAVRDWLVKNANIPEANISLHPIGEAQPVASNATAEGRQLNRRVEIVARRAQKGK